jgi:hypothetical protein
VVLLVLTSLAWRAACGAAGAPFPADRPVLRMLWQSFAEVGGHPALDIGAAITVEGWVYQTEPIAYDAFVFGRTCEGACDAAYRVTLARRGSLEFMRMQYGYDGPCCPGIGGEHVTLAQRQWVHLAAVVSATLSRFYVGGVEVGASDTPAVTPPGSGPFRIGPGFQGGIADLRAWNRELPAAEIAAIAAGGGPVSLAGLAAHWPLDDGAGQIARDVGPHGLHLVLGGGLDHDSRRDPQWITAGLLAEGPFFERRLQVPYEDLAILDRFGEGIAADADGDGRSDYFGLLGPPNDRLVCEWPHFVGDLPPQGPAFRNSGDGALDLDPAIVEYQLSGSGFRHLLGDFTGDGRQDVFAIDSGIEFFFTPLDCGPPGRHDPADSPGGQNRLFVAQPGGLLREETLQRVPPRLSFDHSGAAADIDGDDDLDVYAGASGGTDLADCQAANFYPGVACPVILVNGGSGYFFEDHTRLPLLLSSVRDFHFPASLFVDVEQDGDPDLVLGGASRAEAPLSRDRVLRNDGTGHFVETPVDTIPPPPGGDVTFTGVLFLASADFDRDGFPDLLACQAGPTTLALYFNQGDGTFRDGHRAIPQSVRPESQWPDTTFKRCLPASLNGDGAVDFFCSGSGYERVHLYLNRGDGTFELMPAVDDVDVNADFFASDLDGDGDDDLVGHWPLITYVQLKPFRPVLDLQPGPPPGHWQAAPGGDDILVKTRMTGRANPAGLAALLAALAADLRANGDAAALALPPRLGLEVWLKRLSDERIFYRKAAGRVPRRLPGSLPSS